MPLRDFLELDATPAAAGDARRHLVGVLAEWGLGHLRDSGEMVLAELIANSVVASPVAPGAVGPPVRLWIRGDSTRVLVIVWDAVTRLPVPRDAGPDDENGRGLALVAAFSAQWGHYLPIALCGGKVTWALISDP